MIDKSSVGPGRGLWWTRWMSSSRAALARRFGGPESVQVEQREVADPKPGRVLIDVRAAGMNPVDLKQVAGLMRRDESRLPIRPGLEVAGVIAAVGEDAVGPLGALTVGDRVIAYPVVGGYADRVVAKADNVFPLPAGLDFPAGANLLLAGTTAAHLIAATGVGPGSTVLVHGASGGVGLLAVQLARLRGARVIGTSGERGAELLRGFGAEPVAYGDGLEQRVRALAPDGLTAALDCIGTAEALAVSVALLDDVRHLATIANAAEVLAAGGQALGGGPGADPGTAVRNAARAELIGLADRGDLRVVVARTFPLDSLGEALTVLQSGHPGGKLALVP